MDATDATPQRLKVAVELFLEGQPLVYEGVVFWKDNDRALHINSYSDWEPDRTNPDMAKEKIERAKMVLADLSEKSPEFKGIATKLPHEHYFCYHYGMGAFALAQETKGVFKWRYQKITNG
jgi:hypothetical protein